MRPEWNRSQSHQRHISPIKHARLNLKGTIKFDLEQHRDPSKNERVEGKKQQLIWCLDFRSVTRTDYSETTPAQMMNGSDMAKPGHPFTNGHQPTHSQRQSVVVLVHGDNLTSRYGDSIYESARNLGQIDISRVYMNARRKSAWHDVNEYHMIHSGTGKNATDLLLAIDAIEFALCGGCPKTIVIASSDGDFVHLHRRLREYGVTTIGAGTAQTPDVVRSACSKFIELSAPVGGAKADAIYKDVPEIDKRIPDILDANSKKGEGMPLTILCAKMYDEHGTKTAELPEKTWRRYLQSKPELYDLDDPGQNAHVWSNLGA